MPKQTFFNLPDEKRQHIVDIALDEFANNDFHNASLSRIVSRAGIAKGSIYQYFEDKRDLYFYLLDLAAQEKMAFLQQRPPEDTTDIFSHIKWLVEAGANFQFSNPRLAGLGYRALYDDVMQDEATQHIGAASAGFFGGLLRQGLAQGDIDPTVDPDLAAFVFETIFLNFGAYLLRRMNVSEQDVQARGLSVLGSSEAEQIFTDLLNILQHGIGKRET